MQGLNLRKIKREGPSVLCMSAKRFKASLKFVKVLISLLKTSLRMPVVSLAQYGHKDSPASRKAIPDSCYRREARREYGFQGSGRKGRAVRTQWLSWKALMICNKVMRRYRGKNTCLERGDRPCYSNFLKGTGQISPYRKTWRRPSGFQDQLPMGEEEVEL